MTADQRLVPGIVGFAPATDAVYLRALQSAASSGHGLVNTLRTLTATLDTDRFFGLDAEGRTAEAEAMAVAAAEALRAGGADFLVVTSNTGSVIFEGAADRMLPVLDIFDTVARETRGTGATTAGLLSTRRTAESGRYGTAGEAHGLTVLTPPAELVDRIDELIGREAIRGIQTPESLRLLQDAVDGFAARGADAVILGCTDLMLFGLEQIGHGVLPIVDSTRAHARAAARLALDGL